MSIGPCGWANPYEEGFSRGRESGRENDLKEGFNLGGDFSSYLAEFGFLTSLYCFSHRTVREASLEALDSLLIKAGESYSKVFHEVFPKYEKYRTHVERLRLNFYSKTD